MNLHNDKQAFEELLTATSNLLSIPVEIVEKDYRFELYQQNT